MFKRPKSSREQDVFGKLPGPLRAGEDGREVDGD